MNSAMLTTPLLELRFERCGDRFRHQVGLAGGLGSDVVLRSIEGQPDDEWPPSPPLQSMHLATDPNGRRRLMLVGMAGSSHWSMTVEAEVAHDRFHFDVACRVREQPHYLGSRYDALTNSSGLGDRIIAVAVPPAVVKNESCTIVLPRPQPLAELPITIRWQYSIVAANHAA
jgi:hypothetical protein